MKLSLVAFVFLAAGLSTGAQTQTGVLASDGTVKMTGTHCFITGSGSEYRTYTEIPCPLEVGGDADKKLAVANEKIAKLEAQVKCWKDWYAKFKAWESCNAASLSGCEF